MKSCCVVGLGYIGLPTAAVIAKSNISISGYDINKTRVELINKGLIDFKEPGLENLLKELMSRKLMVGLKIHQTLFTIKANFKVRLIEHTSWTNL
mgnify:CR=1 FL=1